MLQQKQPKRSVRERLFVAAMVFGVLGLSFVIAYSSHAGEIYSWQTADGNVAFTDNPKNIPARYRDQVQVRKSVGIENYARFTAEDSAASERYSDQLAKRVEYLRRANSSPVAAPAYPENVGLATVTVSGVDLRLPAADTDAPIIVEKHRVQAEGQIATRHDTLVSQGGTPLAIVRGDQRAEADASSSILDEEDLESYR